MTSAVEVAAQRSLTEAFIAVDPVDVVILRATAEPTAAGGVRRGAAAALTPQTVRLVPQAGTGGSGVSRVGTDQGDILFADFILVARYDADIQEDDEFVLDGKRHTINGLTVVGHYEKKGSVRRAG